MEYRRKGDKIVARLDRGEELVEKLRELAELENIRFATVIGHGQSNSAELYTFNDAAPAYSTERSRVPSQSMRRCGICRKRRTTSWPRSPALCLDPRQWTSPLQ